MASIGPIKRALGALAVGCFAIGVSEFLIIGLLPQAAADLGVSIPRAGELISGYALGVVVGAPLLTILAVRLRRRALLIGLMVWYAVGNLLTAGAPSFPLAVLARFLTGLPHGAFIGVGAVVASSLVDRSRAATATAVMFSGLTIANVVGVPVTTLAGQHTSWRLMYVVEAGIALIAAALIALFVADREAPPGKNALRAELASFGDGRVWLALGVAMFSFSGLFATFSYIAPMMTHNAGFAESSLTWLLALFGIGMTIGTVLGARLGDRYPTGAIFGPLLAEIVLALFFAASTHTKLVSALLILTFPIAALAVAPALQVRIIGLAGGAPNLAAASMQAAFNVANSLGAFLGGVVIARGFGYAAPNVVGAILVTIGVLLMFVLTRLDRPQVDVVASAAAASTTGMIE